MQQFSYTSYTSSFHSVQEVIEHMHAVQEELTGTDMHNLRAFNKTYLIITQNVYKKIGTGYFQYDDIMSEVDTNFASYYFHALKAYVDGKTPPPAWKILFGLCKKNTHYQFIYMALGVNAHVNNDLSQSLNDVVKNEQYKSDFDKVNSLIHDSIPEVIASLEETSRFISFSEKILIPIYTVFLDHLIKNWRNDTWSTYISLQNKKMTIIQIEEKAEKLANTLSKVKHVYDMHHLRNVFL